ncbi:MAG: HupE/UreJ family protein, partial [Acidimicrobiia bacterium]|nr:HupE/UreJ family protein [Acidimicrobiia bacterium]
MNVRRSLAVGTVAVLAALVAVLGVTAPPVAAHETLQPYLYVFVTESTVDGRIELAVDDVATVLGLDLDGDDATIEATLREQAELVKAYVADHIAIGSEGREWDLAFGRVDLFREGPGGLAFAVVQYEATVPASEVTRVLDITFDPFFDEIEGRDGLLLLSGGWESGIYDRNKEALVTYTREDRTQSIDLGGRGEWANFRSGVTLGIDHIKTGPDHILFVLALLLPSVLVFREAWGPTRGFGSALWRVVKIATFFTIAHSITFTLAGMGWLPLPPSKLVEAIIAASIAAAALHNLRPMFPNREWVLAFVFGLFHGMGFASLVAALDVSRTSQLVSLLGRNVGIEIGQV